MITMTLNCRGLASLPKKLAVRRLIDEHLIDVLFLQETMCGGELLVSKMESMNHGWKFLSVDAKGKSRGLLLGWRMRPFHLINAWDFGSSLCALLHSVELKMTIVCINFYGPYVDREFFWINLFKMECLLSSKLILGGDLNFSVGLSEIWGDKARVDNLSDFFIRQMEDASLVDIAPTILLPTWNNQRVGCENIYKRLARFLLSSGFLDLHLHFRQWIGSGGDSDHNPDFMQFLTKESRPRSPFKFNASWLEDEDFVALLKSTWIGFSDNLEISPAAHFTSNLNKIKEVSISWLVTKKLQEDKDLVDIEFSLADLHK